MITDKDFKLIRFDFIIPNLECMYDYNKSIMLLERPCPLSMLRTGFKRFWASCLYDVPTHILMSSELKDKVIHVTISKDKLAKIYQSYGDTKQLHDNLFCMLQTQYKIPNLKNVIIYGC